MGVATVIYHGALRERAPPSVHVESRLNVSCFAPYDRDMFLVSTDHI